jgi:hypothetical protein
MESSNVDVVAGISIRRSELALETQDFYLKVTNYNKVT